MSKTEHEYTKGFNDGYLIAKHEQIELQKILSSIDITPDEYGVGLTDGVEQHKKELHYERLAELREIRKGKIQNKDRDR